MIHTQKRERNPNITVKIVIRTQGRDQRKKKGTKKNYKTTPDNEQKWQSVHAYDNYFKCKWANCSNKKK